MHSVAIVTGTSKTPLGDIMCRNLEEVLGGTVELRVCAFDQLRSGEAIEADLVLVMVQRMIQALEPHLPDPERILVVKRTLRAKDAYRIFAIPPATQVLVVNDHPETTRETVALLQQLKVNHLQFLAFEPGMDCGDLNIAITPAEGALVPPHIGNVIDVGHRCLDISTFTEIIHRLGIADSEVDRRLLRYFEAIIPLDTGINRQFKELYLKNKELETVINLSHDGILLVNTQGKVILCNRALAEMLDIQGDTSLGVPMAAFSPEIQGILGKASGREWIVAFKGRSLVVTRQAVKDFGEPAGSYFNFQEATFIRKLEQNLSAKLRTLGHTARYRFADLLTRAPRMIQCVDMARRIARSDFTVLILGETGTGKELLAQSIHQESARGRQPFVAVNCAAVPENLLESELFGYEGGSFTGALKDGKAGLFEQANNGTVFLDEIADMPLVLQAKLLRVLQERQVVRVGSQQVIDVKIRVIAATNHDLRERISEGRFREDLYYRLNTLPLLVPPLRQRPEDIFLLLDHFLAEHKRKGLTFSPQAREVLVDYPWPGNIRELANVASYLSFMTDQQVTLADLPYYLTGTVKPPVKVAAQPRPGLDRARAVLDALSVQPRGAGRKSLEEALARQGLVFSEGEIRRILKLLSQSGLVRSRVGRGGSELTERGSAFVGAEP
jgi:transcriptional regulator with PAS, ATPase and Fis domain